MDLDVADGEFISLLGPSGCGKSTLLRCIAGLEALSSGSLHVRGAAVDGPPDGIGMVFQRDALLDWRTILGNVLLEVELRGQPARAHADRARALLGRFGLARSPTATPGSCRRHAPARIDLPRHAERAAHPADGTSPLARWMR